MPAAKVHTDARTDSPGCHVSRSDEENERVVLDAAQIVCNCDAAQNKIASLQKRITDLTDKHKQVAAEELAQIEQLEEDIDYLRRRLKLLEDEDDNELEVRTRQWMTTLSGMNQRICDNFLKAFEHKNKFIAEQERDLLLAFKARLFDRLQELAALRATRDEKAAAWISRVHQLEAAYDYAKETGDAMQRNCTKLSQLNCELRHKASRVSVERNRMINDLVLSKKRANALREEIARLEMVDCERPEQEAARDQCENVKLEEPAIEESNILNKVEAKRLKRSIQQERAKVLALRQNHATARRVSTGLRELLRLFCQATRIRIEKLQSRKARPTSAAAVVTRRSPPLFFDGNPPPKTSPLASCMKSPHFDFWSFAQVLGKSTTRNMNYDDGALPIDLASQSAAPILPRTGSTPQQSRTILAPNQVILQFEVQLRVVTRLAQLAFAPISNTEHNLGHPETTRGIPLHRRPQSASVINSRVNCLRREGKIFDETRPNLKEERCPEGSALTRATRPASAAPAPRYSSLRRGADGNAVTVSVHVETGIAAALASRPRQSRSRARPVTR